jgi:transposase
MTKRTRRTPAGLQGEGGAGRDQGRKTLAELAQQYDVHPNQITSWKAHPVEAASGLFGSTGSAASDAAPAIDMKTLHAKIGELSFAARPGDRTAEPSLGEAGQGSGGAE